MSLPRFRGIAATCALSAVLVAPGPSYASLGPTPAATLFAGTAGRQLGRTVATAGDVNGDGYSDVLVTEKGTSGSGTVQLYLGGPGGNLFDPSRRVWQKVNFPFGVQAAGIGDINGDGFDDFAVAWGFRVRVYLGTGSPGVVDTVHTFDFSPSASVNDVANFPVVVGPAGDVNGDGVDDMYIGSAESRACLGNTGTVWVFYGALGTAGNPMPLSQARSTALCAVSVGLDDLGASVGGAGDIDGDGFADLVAGAPASSTPNGAIVVYRGSSTGIMTTPSAVIRGSQAGGQFGASVAIVGDVNADGFCDVLVGAPNETLGSLNHDGSTYLFLGSSTGLATTPVWSENGPASGDALGSSVATAGDVNGDGFADFLVGIPNRTQTQTHEGQFSLYLGGRVPSGLTTSFFPASGVAGAALGSDVAAAGDVNGDGMGDVIVSAPLYASGTNVGGGAFLYLGHGELPATSPVRTVFGGPSGQLGTAVATGDFDGDGITDVAMGEPGTLNGRVTVEFGTDAGAGSATLFAAPGPMTRAGVSLALQGDEDDDGFADLAIGAVATGASDSGAVMIVRGNASRSTATIAAIVRSPGTWVTPPADGFATSLAWADVNGDGYSDLVVGAPLWNGPLGTGQGRVLVYFGSASGLHTNQQPSQELDGPGATSHFGASLACAGDFNRDGIEDVVIGAPGYDVKQGLLVVKVDAGYSAVYPGGAHGLSSTPLASGAGPTLARLPGYQLGATVAAAGDLDGDGFSDVVVSAAAAELVQIWYGGATGSTVVEIPTPQSGSGFGAALAPAGDVDGDGFGDLLIGAPVYVGVHAVAEGRAMLFRGGASRSFGTPDWFVDGGVDGAAFGAAVVAGDMNSDGYPDPIVGASAYPVAGSPRGVVQRFLADRGANLLAPHGVTNALAHPFGPQTSSGGPGFGVFGSRERGPTGRVRARLQLTADRVAYGSEHLTASGPDVDNGASTTAEYVHVSGAAGRPYSWKARWRVHNPYFPWTPGTPGTLLGRDIYSVLTGGLPLAVGPEARSMLDLSAPSPSPYRGGSLAVNFTLHTAGQATLRLYDVLGRARRTLLAEPLSAGPHAVEWDGRDDAGARVPAGVYWLRLVSGIASASRVVVRVN